jgi:hypothetical protein
MLPVIPSAQAIAAAAFIIMIFPSVLAGLRHEQSSFENNNRPKSLQRA